MNQIAAPRNKGIWLSLGLWVGVLVLFAQQGLWRTVLGWLFPSVQTPIFERQTLFNLALEHLGLTFVAGGLVLGVGLPLAVWVSRSQGEAFRPLVENLAAVGQTFPPPAVLALALPLFGFGAQGAVLALFIYGLLPVVRNTLEGLAGLPQDVLESARGMGLSPRERLFRVELPLALPVILSGIRTSFVLILATATLAPLVGGGGLGVPIIAGLAVSNLALVAQGAAAVAILAILLDYTFAQLEAFLAPWRRLLSRSTHNEPVEIVGVGREVAYRTESREIVEVEEVE